jgi:hypothetical protein
MANHELVCPLAARPISKRLGLAAIHIYDGTVEKTAVTTDDEAHQTRHIGGLADPPRAVLRHLPALGLRLVDALDAAASLMRLANRLVRMSPGLIALT